MTLWQGMTKQILLLDITVPTALAEPEVEVKKIKEHFTKCQGH
jgi:hypothetical protein